MTRDPEQEQANRRLMGGILGALGGTVLGTIVLQLSHALFSEEELPLPPALIILLTPIPLLGLGAGIYYAEATGSRTNRRANRKLPVRGDRITNAALVRALTAE